MEVSTKETRKIDRSVGSHLELLGEMAERKVEEENSLSIEFSRETHRRTARCSRKIGICSFFSSPRNDVSMKILADSRTYQQG